jgi:hypothetical protein
LGGREGWRGDHSVKKGLPYCPRSGPVNIDKNPFSYPAKQYVYCSHREEIVREKQWWSI